MLTDSASSLVQESEREKEHRLAAEAALTQAQETIETLRSQVTKMQQQQDTRDKAHSAAIAKLQIEAETSFIEGKKVPACLPACLSVRLTS